MAKRLIPVETACPLVKSMGAIGDWLSFLIVLDACKGPQRFDEFQTNLGLTRKVLSERLRSLVACGVFETASGFRWCPSGIRPDSERTGSSHRRFRAMPIGCVRVGQTPPPDARWRRARASGLPSAHQDETLDGMGCIVQEYHGFRNAKDSGDFAFECCQVPQG